MKSACGTWGSPWGLDEGDGPPEKAYLFPPVGSERPSTWSMEDFLQHNGIFYNGLRGEDCTCHSDSYMTCVSFTRLDVCLDLLQETFKPAPEEWQMLTDGWLGSPNTQPPLKMVACLICDRHGIEKATVDHSKWR